QVIFYPCEFNPPNVLYKKRDRHTVAKSCGWPKATRRAKRFYFRKYKKTLRFFNRSVWISWFLSRPWKSVLLCRVSFIAT
ncbi:hypothetical protein N9Y42_02380, partial [Mariniblastus sp.]|nr:hypothetical protein [Mariniblastus sp.]